MCYPPPWAKPHPHCYHGKNFQPKIHLNCFLNIRLSHAQTKSGSSSTDFFLVFLNFTPFATGKKKQPANSRKDLRKITPKFATFLGKIIETSISRLQVLASHKYIKGFQKKFTFLSVLQPDLAKSSCGGSPVHLPHEVEKKPCTAIFLIKLHAWGFTLHKQVLCEQHPCFHLMSWAREVSLTFQSFGSTAFALTKWLSPSPSVVSGVQPLASAPICHQGVTRFACSFA